MDLQSLKSELEEAGQQHLLQFWDSLTDDQKEVLYRDLKSIRFQEVTRIFEESTRPQDNGGLDDSLLEPLPADVHESVLRSSEATLGEYREEGRLIECCVLPFLLYFQ